MIKNWWKNWVLIDLALGLGLLLCITYIAYRRTEGFERSVLDLWPNIASEILGVWISVRIIDALISRREERSRLRDSVVGNLNYMMSISQDLPLHFDNWRLIDLSNELKWFEEKRAAKQRLFRKHFTGEEQTDINAVIEQVRVVHQLSRQAAAMKLEVVAAEHDGMAWDRPNEVKQLFREYHLFVTSGGMNDESLSKALGLVRQGMEQRLYPNDKNAEIERILNAVTKWHDDARQVRESVHGVETSLKKLRHTIAAGA